MKKACVIEPFFYETGYSPLVSLGFGTVTSYFRNQGFDTAQISLNVLEKSQKKGLEDRDLEFGLLRNKKRNRKNIEELDKKIRREYQNLVSEISVGKFDIVCITLISSQQAIYAVNLAEAIKKVSPETTVLLGGASFRKKDTAYLTLHDDVDLCFRGQIEAVDIRPEDELEDLKKKQGFCYFENGEFKIKEPAKTSIEKQPAPYYHPFIVNILKDLSLINSFVIPYKIGIRCVNNCSFCNFSPDRRFEYKSETKILKEMKELSERYGSENFFFCESNLMNSPERLSSICETLATKNFRWGGNASYISKEGSFFERLAEGGCRFLMHGLESGSERMLDLMKKPFRLDTVRGNMLDEKKCGIKNYNHILLGFPGERDKDSGQTISFLRENFSLINGISNHTFGVLRGSEVYRYPGRFRVKIIEENNYPDFKDTKEYDDNKVLNYINASEFVDYREKGESREKTETRKLRRKHQLDMVKKALDIKEGYHMKLRRLANYLFRPPYIDSYNSLDLYFVKSDR